MIGAMLGAVIGTMAAGLFLATAATCIQWRRRERERAAWRQWWQAIGRGSP